MQEQRSQCGRPPRRLSVSHPAPPATKRGSGDNPLVASRSRTSEEHSSNASCPPPSLPSPPSPPSPPSSPPTSPPSSPQPPSDLAARRLQAAWRASQRRAGFRRFLEELRLQRDRRDAATRIQGCVRGRAAGRCFAAVVHAARQQQAAARLQRVWSGRQFRRQMSLGLVELPSHCADMSLPCTPAAVSGSGGLQLAPAPPAAAAVGTDDCRRGAAASAKGDVQGDDGRGRGHVRGKGRRSHR